MIQRLSDKQKPCTYCTQYGHTAFRCPRKPRKTIQNRTTLSTTKPMNKRGKVAKQTDAAVAAWKRTIKPNHQGYYKCHYCAAMVDYLMAEHMESKVRRPDLRTDHANYVPVCAPCNAKKLSKSHDEIPHVCSLSS